MRRNLEERNENGESYNVCDAQGNLTGLTGRNLGEKGKSMDVRGRQVRAVLTY